MEYFFEAWETVAAQIGAKPLMLFFDFDGTLAPIVDSPDQARLSQEMSGLLTALSENKSCKVAIVSGRGLLDVEQRIDVENLVYIGNHGLEIEGPGIKHAITVEDEYIEALKAVKFDLQDIITGYKGAFVEDKFLTLSVHFRLVPLEKIMELHNKIRAGLLPYCKNNLIKIRSGKMVLEIRPSVFWDKGKAVLWVIDRWQAIFGGDSAVPLYCGDDATDEDAFRLLAGKGITVVVGAHEDSAAQYYLNSQREVGDLLMNIIELKKTLK